MKNALTHGEAEQPVTIRAWIADKVFVLEVENFGHPIEKAKQRTIFSAFEKNSIKNNSEGLGLGLFIVSEIAKAHGGTATVHSDERSTIFALHLPQP